MESNFATPLLNFVRRYLVPGEVECYRHCGQSSKFVPTYQKDSSLMGAYACGEGYVSRVVYFADNPDSVWFENYLKDQLGDRLRGKDIRMATRHGWELGGEAEKEISAVSKSGKIVQYYWSFYALNDQEKQFGAFLCPKERGGCGKFYFKSIKGDDFELCPECRVLSPS